MTQQVYNCGTIEISSAPYTGRKTIVGVFAINAECNDFRYHLSDYSLDEIPDLDEQTFRGLRTTLSLWLKNLRDRSDTPVEILTTARGGLIQFVARGSFLINPENHLWFEKVVAEYLPTSSTAA